MQNLYSFNGFTPERQPIKVTPSFAKTSTADSGRNQFGYADNKVLFTVQSYKVDFPTLYKNDMVGMLNAIRVHQNFDFHYFNPYRGEWLTETFYVENINTDGIYVEDGKEKLLGLNFQITAINPV